MTTVDAPRPIDVGDRKQLFTDNRFFHRSSGIELRLNPPGSRVSRSCAPTGPGT